MQGQEGLEDKRTSGPTKRGRGDRKQGTFKGDMGGEGCGMMGWEHGGRRETGRGTGEEGAEETSNKSQNNRLPKREISQSPIGVRYI